MSQRKRSFNTKIFPPLPPTQHPFYNMQILYNCEVHDYKRNNKKIIITVCIYCMYNKKIIITFFFFWETGSYL